MNIKEKLEEATIKALQEKFIEEEKENLRYLLMDYLESKVHYKNLKKKGIFKNKLTMENYAKILAQDFAKKYNKKYEDIETYLDDIYDYLNDVKTWGNEDDDEDDISENWFSHNDFVANISKTFDMPINIAEIIANWYENEYAQEDYDNMKDLIKFVKDDIYDMLDGATDTEEIKLVSKYIN